jgi:hypothetical protein
MNSVELLALPVQSRPNAHCNEPSSACRTPTWSTVETNAGEQSSFRALPWPSKLGLPQAVNGGLSSPLANTDPGTMRGLDTALQLVDGTDVIRVSTKVRRVIGLIKRADPLQPRGVEIRLARLHGDF